MLDHSTVSGISSRCALDRSGCVLIEHSNSIQLRDPETSLDQPSDYSSYPQLQQSQVLSAPT